MKKPHRIGVFPYGEMCICKARAKVTGSPDAQKRRDAAAPRP